MMIAIVLPNPTSAATSGRDEDRQAQALAPRRQLERRGRAQRGSEPLGAAVGGGGQQSLEIHGVGEGRCGQ